MNTTEIGDRFESKSLDIIKRVIEEEQLGHMIDYIRIYQKKGYHSTLRKKKIKFDLTIEVWPPGATRYVLLYIVECKDHAKRVPVNKIEDFLSKIKQVAGVNVKGIFISNSPLMEGGYNIAESVGMMVIIGESSEDYKIVLHKRTRLTESAKIPIISDTLDNSLLVGTEPIERLIDKKLLGCFQLVTSSSRVSYGIDKLAKEDIERVANEELVKIDDKIISGTHALSPTKLKKYLLSEYKITIHDIVDPSLVGSCNFITNSISVNLSVQNTNRELFIIAHEFGHFMLHQKLSIGQALYNSFDDSEFSFRTGKHDLHNPRQWIEWQANFFAASLALPKVSFLANLWKIQDRLGKTQGKIYLNDEQRNVKDFMSIIEKLAYFFSVSKTSVIYRLNEMQLVNDQSRVRSIGQIIAEYRDNLFV